MAKHRRADREDEPEPLEAGLKGPASSSYEDWDTAPDEYLLLKVVEANGEHLRTMRWGLALGIVLLAANPLVLIELGPVVCLFWTLLALAFLGAGLHALARQLELLRRAVAATDHYVFGNQDEVP